MTMAKIGTNWTETTINWLDAARAVSGVPIARAAGWSFYENPNEGGNVLAMSLDRIGPEGPIVYDTGSPDLPEYL